MGPSNIPAWALKGSITVIAEPLCFLINAFLNEGNFPSDLKQDHVCPIFKKGDTEDPNNYRPISITAALSKVFEKVIREQITNYIDNNKLFSPRHFGFRKNISTMDALVFTTEKIRKKLITITLLLLLFWIYQKPSTLFHMKYFSKSWKHFILIQTQFH